MSTSFYSALPLNVLHAQLGQNDSKTDKLRKVATDCIPATRLSCWRQTEQARLVLMCVGVQEAKEEAELNLQQCELNVTAYEVAVAKLRAALFELLLRVNGVHIPAWLR